MLKARTLRIGISAVAVAALAGGLGLASGGTSLAAAQQRVHTVTLRAASAPQVASLDYNCYFPITSPYYCQAPVFKGAPLFKPSGALDVILPANDKVDVTCYYPGNPPSPYKGDGIWDHVTHENIAHPITGHVPDYYVNFDGQTPAQLGLPRC